MKNFDVYAFADEASPMLDGQIAAMLRNGLKGLEIRGVDGENISTISLEKVREIRRKLDDAGLRVWSVGSPIGKIDVEKDDFQAHVRVFRQTLEAARILGAQNMRMFSFYIPAGKDPGDFRGEVIDRLGRLLEIARGSGVMLCHENEKGIFGDVAVRCRELLDALPELVGVFDPANFVQCGQETWAAWEMLGERVKYLHVKDALADGRVVPAGQGVGNVGRILEAFWDRGGRAVSVEPHLAEFVGLGGLERNGETSVVGGMRFASQDEAFDAACKACRALF